MIDVENDYIGKLAADVDPWFWLDQGFSALIVREVAGNAERNLVGWHKETGTMPVIDGVDDGVLFIGSNGPGYSRTVQLNGMQRFGFYMNPNGRYSSANAPDGELFFTNRTYNDLGPDGSGAVHAPFDADVQALIFDISAITGTPNQWLVCWEDLDSGAPISPCCDGVDNDWLVEGNTATAVSSPPAGACVVP